MPMMFKLTRRGAAPIAQSQRLATALKASHGDHALARLLRRQLV